MSLEGQPAQRHQTPAMRERPCGPMAWVEHTSPLPVLFQHDMYACVSAPARAQMAPEVATTGRLTKASDAFSFAITAYECVSGMRPYVLGPKRTHELNVLFKQGLMSDDNPAMLIIRRCAWMSGGRMEGGEGALQPGRGSRGQGKGRGSRGPGELPLSTFGW
jgi:hypothetical protein